MSVYKAICAVMADLSVSGITKDKRNQQQGYTFRCIDDVLNALSPVMSRHGLTMLPRVLSRTVTERATAQGKTLFYVVVDVEFDLVCAEDGSKHVIRHRSACASCQGADLHSIAARRTGRTPVTFSSQEARDGEVSRLSESWRARRCSLPSRRW